MSSGLRKEQRKHKMAPHSKREKDVYDVTYYYIEGHKLFKLQRYEEAVTAIEQAIHLDPDQAQFYFWKSAALRALKRNTEALAAYEQAVRLDSRYAPGIFPQASNMFERGAGE